MHHQDKSISKFPFHSLFLWNFSQGKICGWAVYGVKCLTLEVGGTIQERERDLLKALPDTIDELRIDDSRETIERST